MIIKFNQKLLFVSVLCLYLISNIFSQVNKSEKKPPVDWSIPELIDPYREDIGDFIDVNLAEYGWKAREAYRQKNYEAAAKYYLYILRHKHDDARTIYSLACCYGKLKKPELAAKYLVRAANAGWTDMDHMAEDPDFDKVRNNLLFKANQNNLVSWASNFGKIVYFESPKLMTCRLHLPDDFDEDKSYTLVVGLHGNGGNPTEFSSLWKDMGEHDFIYAIPGAPYPHTRYVSSKWDQYYWDFHSGEKEIRLMNDQVVEKYVLKTIEHFSRMYNIKDVFLFGFSAGTCVAYYVGIKNHDLIRGMICFGGSLPNTKQFDNMLSDKDIKAAKKLKVFIGHGDQDVGGDSNYGERAKKILDKHGYDVTFRGFSGGHVVRRDVLKEAINWMRNKLSN